MATPPTKARTRLAIGSMRTAITLGAGPSNLFSRTGPSTETLILVVPRCRATPPVGRHRSSTGCKHSTGDSSQRWPLDTGGSSCPSSWRPIGGEGMAERGSGGWLPLHMWRRRQRMSRFGHRTSWKVPKIEALRVFVRASQVPGDPTRHLRPRGEVQFGQDVFEVALNCSFRQEQTLGDGAAGHPRSNQFGHLQLALAQAAGAP